MSDTKPVTVLSVRLPTTLYKRLEAKARREDRSVASLIRLAVKNLVDEAPMKSSHRAEFEALHAQLQETLAVANRQVAELVEKVEIGELDSDDEREDLLAAVEKELLKKPKGDTKELLLAIRRELETPAARDELRDQLESTMALVERISAMPKKETVDEGSPAS